MDKHTGNLRMSAHAYGALQPSNMEAEEVVQQDQEAPPVSFADLGIPQPPKLQNTLLGKVRVCFTFCVL